MWYWSTNIRFKFGDKPKKTAPPSLPPPVEPRPQQIVEEAQKVGEVEGRRLRKRTGRRATRLTQPNLAFVPAPTARAGLKTKLGATV